jgi:superfamily II DNA or RNA helicase
MKAAKHLSALAVALLDRLEREERKLLSWGYTEGAFEERELDEHARAIFETHPLKATIDPGSLITELLDDAWLFKLPSEDRYRTRSAETIRLLSKLRQIRVYPSTRRQDLPNLWQTAPPLVADYRFLAPPRTFPRRDLTVGQAESSLHSVSPLQRDVFRAFVGAGTKQERKLSGFQVRATDRILGHAEGSGTVVCAGTGSGKTLAFYLPAFMTLAPLIDDSAFTKCIAIYPRNELLKDQLREALSNAGKVASVLNAHGKRGLTFGALFGDVKEDNAQVAHPRFGWPERTFAGKRGRLCPFVSCSRCGAPTFWADEDRARGHERVRCSASGCSAEIGPDVLRLTRGSLRLHPPDVLFVSTEMLNRNMAASEYARLLGIGLPEARRPRLLLLDEVHTCEGSSGAHVALLLRRWRHHSKARPHAVGLSATLEDAERFFADLVGLKSSVVAEVSPLASELDAEGADYQLAIRADSSWGTSVLSTTIQTLMLMRRVLALRGDDAVLTGNRVFAFSDRLDGINRLLENLRDAEARWPGNNALRNNRTVLAGLRARGLPNPDVRYAEGQCWDLVETIAHKLDPTPTQESSLVVTRTTSQDTGVEANSDVVVATGSLEVGYDDPRVGAIVQHKAPKSAASFLQRKGRAGRLRREREDGTTISMRPWTIVVLSDFGRDRLAYQDYEHVFSPTLKAKHLPTKNRALLRMQATYVLFEFLGVQARKANFSPDPWIDLAARADGEGQPARDLRERQRFYENALRRLLEEREEQASFAKFVQAALALDADEVQALLWEAPRSVLLEAVPTLLRRLTRSWERAFETSFEPQERSGPPLPEFVQKTLFSKLLIPEVKLTLPIEPRRARRDLGAEDAFDEAGMVLGDAFREFAPGRVSKRFDIRGDVSHWIDPGEGATISIDTFSSSDDRVPLGRFVYWECGTKTAVDVFRPLALRATIPPNGIATTSNARPRWRSEIVSLRAGHPVELPDGSTFKSMVEGITFHTHHLGCPIELRRFIIGSDVYISRTGGKRDPERQLHFVDSAGSKVGLGWVSEVDALAVQFAFPTDLLDYVKTSPELLRSLRTLRFRDLLRSDSSLDGVLDTFQRDALVDAFVAALLLELSASTETSVARVGNALGLQDVARAVVQVIDGGEEEDDDESEPTPRRVRDLKAALENPLVFARLRTHGSVLWSEPDETWLCWLRIVFRSTLGATFREAVMSLCPEVDDDDLIVEADGAHQDDAQTVWLTEAAVGGSGALEAFYAAYARDPRRFVRVWHSCFEPSTSERVANALEGVLDSLAGPTPSSYLVTAVAGIRTATDHANTSRRIDALREAVAALGFYAEHPTLTALFARVLRPGSSPGLDAYLAATLASWRALEERAGLIVEAKHFALIRSREAGLEEHLPMAPSASDRSALQSWRFTTLLGLLWRRSSSVRRDALTLGNHFIATPLCDRLIVPLPADRSPTVRVDSPTWFEDLTDALNRNGVARLVAPPAGSGERGSERLAAAIQHLATHPIDTGGLHVFARLAGYARHPNGSQVTVEMPEALQ